MRVTVHFIDANGNRRAVNFSSDAEAEAWLHLWPRIHLVDPPEDPEPSRGGHGVGIAPGDGKSAGA
jgi:hypothetical protein